MNIMNASMHRVNWVVSGFTPPYLKVSESHWTHVYSKLFVRFANLIKRKLVISSILTVFTFKSFHKITLDAVNYFKV